MEIKSILMVMPLYNARPYVHDAIESILTQTYPYFTLLVINDGSTDGSEELVSFFQDKRIMIWHQTNQGPGAVMNRAIELAIERKIDLIGRMDADDISLPRRLELQINLLERYPEAAACSANCYYIDTNSDVITGSSTISTVPCIIRWEILNGMRGLVQGACLFRTDALAQIGGYRKQFRLAEETDLFLRLIEQYELRNCGEYLYKIRIHNDSFSLHNSHENILYKFYALECYKRRRIKNLEPEFKTFCDNLSCRVKFNIWHEEKLLILWRNYMQRRCWYTLLLASILDPRRVLIRGLRKLKF
jgi:glycosyltransferase involved in cell wall biosynthesis